MLPGIFSSHASSGSSVIAMMLACTEFITIPNVPQISPRRTALEEASDSRSPHGSLHDYRRFPNDLKNNSARIDGSKRQKKKLCGLERRILLPLVRDSVSAKDAQSAAPSPDPEAPSNLNFASISVARFRCASLEPSRSN